MIAEIIKKIQPNVPPNKKIPTDSCHDFNFILGDMNFRFNRTYSEHIHEVERSAELIPMYDQLFEVRTKEFKFPLYQELPIDFMPTYKRHHRQNGGVDGGYTNKKEQCPSFTDRILFKNNTSCKESLIAYEEVDEQFGSDHRPVRLSMQINVQPLDFINPQ